VLVIVGVAAAGTLLGTAGAPRGGAAGAGSRIAVLYLPLIVVAWGLLLYVSRIGRPRSALGSLLGVLWPGAAGAAGDLAIAALGWAAILASERAWGLVAGGGRGVASTLALLPHSAPERLAWVAVSLSVGFCEEVVYRGYLQTQLRSFTGSAAAAIVLQGALFGVAHLDQGAAGALRLAVYGAGLGAIARWRRRLLPCIACHVWTDLASGLFLV